MQGALNGLSADRQTNGNALNDHVQEQLLALLPELAERDIVLQEQQFHQLVNYCEMLHKWNRTFNLISRRDIQRLVSRHILDSVSAHHLLCGQRVLDVGSGAGLPGIPLACLNPNRDFVLVDRMARRVRFLSHVVQSLALSRVAVQELDLLASTPVAALGGKLFDTIVARAVAPALDLWQLVGHLLSEQGQMLLYASTQMDEADWRAQLEHLAEVQVEATAHKFPVGNALHTVLQLRAEQDSG
ncbi:MAG: 16S rRNA (guanine(527)-N(7))-methyltransferase RsmG [Pseudomonadota bacterium]